MPPGRWTVVSGRPYLALTYGRKSSVLVPANMAFPLTKQHIRCRRMRSSAIFSRLGLLCNDQPPKLNFATLVDEVILLG